MADLIDPTPRLVKIGDALSQLINVALLPRHHETTANESISGRAHRQGWKRLARLIDWLASPFERDHCRLSHEADMMRADKLLAQQESSRAAGQQNYQQQRS